MNDNPTLSARLQKVLKELERIIKEPKNDKAPKDVRKIS